MVIVCHWEGKSGKWGGSEDGGVEGCVYIVETGVGFRDGLVTRGGW